MVKTNSMFVNRVKQCENIKEIRKEKLSQGSRLGII